MSLVALCFAAATKSRKLARGWSSFGEGGSSHALPTLVLS